MQAPDRISDALDPLIVPHLVVEPPLELRRRLAALAYFAPGPLIARSAEERRSWWWLEPSKLVALALYLVIGLTFAALVLTGTSPSAGPRGLLGEVMKALTLVAFSPAGMMAQELVREIFLRPAWLALLPVIWYLRQEDRASA